MDLYRQQLLAQARQPRHQGQLEDPDKQVSLVNASCGDEISVMIKLDTDKKTITDLKWQGTGCIISQAAMSLLADKVVKHKLTISEVQTYTTDSMIQLLGLDEISAGRIKCLTLGLEALKQIAKERK